MGWMVPDLPKSHPDFGKAVRCDKCTDWLRHSRLTREEQKHTIDDLTDRPGDDPRDEMMALRFMAKAMLVDPFGFFSIWGRKGGGKSMILTALIAEFARAGQQAVYFNASELVTLVSYGDDKEVDGFQKVGSYDAYKQRLKDIPILAIDEMDKIKWTPWQVQHIGEIFEHRHRNVETHVTLLAMNRPPEQWSNPDDVEHIASRLRDGRFNRLWPDEYKDDVPACAHKRMGNKGELLGYELPGLFEVTLPDIRPTLRR
jgi:chromosomal replication initiation ATPase DnaA